VDVLGQGAVMAAAGIGAGVLGGFALLRLAASYFEHVQRPGAVPILGAAVVLLAAALVASVLPALRAARVDITQALRSE
jgi:ABC-type antimicrobial peptide transport system permease subunit